MGNPPWACLRKKDLGWDRGVESKKVVQHVYLVGAKSIYRVAEKDKEYLRDEEEKNQNRKYLYDNADYRLACSDNAGKWMYGNGAFEIIKNGIDTKGFRFCTEYGEEIRAMYGIPMNAFVIGHVGRFTNQKNHSKLIDIFAAIKERKSDAYLLLLGGGELQDTIKSKVEKLNLCDSVIFCGVRTDVNKYLCAMDAFVFPSTWEGLGIVAIEAQASGLECYLSRELPKEVEVTDAVTWFDVSENENAIANMIDLTKVPEETRYIRNIKMYWMR